MKKKNKPIGPLDFFKVGPKLYFTEFTKQWGEFTTPPVKVRTLKELFKDDQGPWSLFFALLTCFVITFLALVLS